MIKVTEFWIPTPKGRLFAQSWIPCPENNLSPILLLHDSLGCTGLWRHFPEKLATRLGRTVISYDRLGFGESAPHPGHLNKNFIQEESEFINTVADFFKLDSFILFGHSIGGGMGLQYAAQFPKKCLAIITEGAQACVESKTRMGIQEAKKHFSITENFHKLERYHGSKAHWVLYSWIDTWMSSEFDNWSLAPILPLIQCPTLVLHGAEDEFGTFVHPEMISSLSSGPTEMKILKDMHHVPHKKDDLLIADISGEFLDNFKLK